MRIYETFNFPASMPNSKTLITGIRETEKKGIYVITGFFKYPKEANLQTASFVYKGHLNNFGKYFILNFPIEDIKQTNLYGPDVISHNIFNIVGNYAIENKKGTIGCLYTGKLNGSGIWKTIIPKSLVSHKEKIINTICHSTSNGLVVGNYDTKLIQGKAFIYDIKEDTYYDIVKTGSLSMTAYGIWYNCKRGDYTICGGFFDANGVESGYLVDWDNKKKKFHNWAVYNYGNDPARSIITHFDGISANGKNEYTLTGVYVRLPNKLPEAFFAKVKRGENHKFCKAKWENLDFTNVAVITGNSVSKDVVIGVFAEDHGDVINGYVSYLKEGK